MTHTRRSSDRLDAPMRRRREDLLEELLEHGSRNFRRYRRRAMLGYALLVVLCAAGFWIGFRRIDDARRDTVVRSCLDSNQRHDDTIRQLDAELARITDPARRARAAAGRKSTIRIINNLAPRKDCEKRADLLVKPAN